MYSKGVGIRFNIKSKKKKTAIVCLQQKNPEPPMK